MSRANRALKWVFARLLCLYPAEFRRQFGEDLAAVFGLSLEDATRLGWRAVIRILAREALTLPVAAVREHMRQERQTMAAEIDHTFPFKPGSAAETWVGLMPFLLVGLVANAIGTATRYLNVAVPDFLSLMTGYSIVFLFLSPLVIGVLLGLPRWALPYLGSALGLATLILASLVLNTIFAVIRIPRYPWLRLAMLNTGVIWLTLLALGLAVAVAARFLRPLRRLRALIRDDWTVLPFCLYSASLTGLMLIFDDYTYDEPVVAAGSIPLIAGAWVYLRAKRPLVRLMALFAGLNLALAVTTAGKQLILALQTWSYWVGGGQYEIPSTVVHWGWLVAVVFAPALLGLWPKRPRPEPPRVVEPQGT